MCLKVHLVILLMYLVHSISWARFWIGIVIRPRRVYMARILLHRLLLRLARVDMLVSGAGLVIYRAVSGSWGWLLGLPVVHCWSLAMHRGTSGSSMASLGRGAASVLVLLGIDASELLRGCWWSGELGPSRL